MQQTTPARASGAVPDRDETVYAVHAQPFVVPNRYRVLGGDGGGSQAAHVVRVILTEEIPTTASPTATASSTEMTAPVEPLALKIRKFGGIIDPATTDLAARIAFIRFIKLHTGIPADFPHVVPVVDVYTSPATPGDVYCVFPATTNTLAEVATSGDITPDQVLHIARYLLRALRLFHLNNIALTNLQPASISIDPDLTDPDSVRIADLLRCIAVPSTANRAVVLGNPAAAAGAGGDASHQGSPSASAQFGKAGSKAAAARAAKDGTALAKDGSAAAAAGKDDPVAQYEAKHSVNLTDNVAAVQAAAERLAAPQGMNALIVPQHLLATSSLQYMAPEVALCDSPNTNTDGKQQQQQPCATAAADMWSLGVILFELATKQRLFPAVDRESYVEMLADVYGGEDVDYVALLGDTPWVRRMAAVAKGRTGVSLSGRLAGVDQRLRFVVARLLRIKPSERATAQDLVTLPHFGGRDVPAGHYVGPLPTGTSGSGPGGKSATSAQRAAEAAAAAAAANAPIVLSAGEFIHEDWAVPMSASEDLLASEITALLHPQQQHQQHQPSHELPQMQQGRGASPEQQDLMATAPAVVA